ncbi:MAG TPA: hypothetical protein PKC76_16450, partial [Saprospiraceae bacterium]|nr:hypothetical protein [Saprospiraceae bacterium]HMP25724.1 hypothetical protein [Saprospiraceae bacterium]
YVPEYLSNLPCGKIRLPHYGVTRTLRPAAERIDDIGIVPDVSIPDYIPKYKWINYVVEELKSR